VLFVAAMPDIPGLRELIKGGAEAGGARAARAAIAFSALVAADLD
jgi:hypothetical protein